MSTFKSQASLVILSSIHSIREGQPTVVLDAVRVDETDIGEEDFSVLVFVFGDVLLNSKNEEHLLLAS